jgi:hypothetical protein
MKGKIKNNKKKVMIEIGSFRTNTSHGLITTIVYMEAKAFDKNEIKKDLYKSKNMATFSHYISGNLYYKVELSVGTYQFPIKTVEKGFVMDSFEREKIATLKLADDLGTTSFNAEIKGSELIRWIEKAIDNEDFIKVG